MRVHAVPFLLLVTFAAPLMAGAPEDCRQLAATDRDAAARCYRSLLLDPSPHVQAEALWGLGDWAAANRAFRAAVAAAPSDADVRARWGRLYLEAHQDADAEALFREALTIDPTHLEAQVGLAEVAAGRFDGRARALAQAVLERVPDHSGARFVLARLALVVGDVQGAREVLLPVVESDEPGARLEAMALLAAGDHLQGLIPSPWTERVLEVHPGYGALSGPFDHKARDRTLCLLWRLLQGPATCRGKSFSGTQRHCDRQPNQGHGPQTNN